MLAKFARLVVLAAKFLIRNRLRTVLTTLGVMLGLCLFTAVETMQRSLERATQSGANDTTLVVYRQNRFCPSTSRLPEQYAEQIRRIEGVREVVPVQVVVNNCGASLDVITFRGVPPALLANYAPEMHVISGTLDAWRARDDGALLGESLAQRRGLKPGDQFSAAGVSVMVSGIIRSPLPQDNDVVYVHLPFLQMTTKNSLGVVTQFNVRVQDSQYLNRVAETIDTLFRHDAEPTDTRPEKAFFAETARELVALIGFTRWLGLGAVAAVAGLVANALLLIVRGRVKENAVLRTLGYPDAAIVSIVLAEGCLLGLLGGLPGVLLAAAIFRWGGLSLGNEGQVLALRPELSVLAGGVLLAMALGFVSSLWPAWQAFRQPLVRCLRA